MIRRIIRIDKEKCNGCGACADACHEGAIDIINGKAELVREHFCDGLGNCLPECPTGAISFEEREAPEYDEEAVKEAQKKISAKNQAISAHTGCPGSRIMQIQRTETPETDQSPSMGPQISRLRNWPVQIKLAPVHAPYFSGAKLLIAADCTAYAYAGFHQDFMRNKVTLIGLSQTGSGGLYRKTDCDHSTERHPERNYPKNGSPLLRRSRNGSQKSASKQWKIYSLASCNDWH